MVEKDFDEIFQSKLSDLETPVDAEVWASIEKDINKTPRRNIFYYTISAAAVILLGLVLWSTADVQLGNQTQESAVQSAMVAESGVKLADKIDVLERVGEGSVAALAVNTPVVAVKKSAVAVDSETSKEVLAESAPESSSVPVEEQVAGDNGVKEETSDKNGVMHNVIGTSAVADARYERQEKGSRRGYSLGLYSNVASSNRGPGEAQYLGIMAAGGTIGSTAQTIDKISQAQYSLPLNLGIQAQINISKLLGIGIGVNYTMLSSKYEALIDKSYYNIKQQLHYIGVPVNLYFNIVNRPNLYIYANVGGAVEKGVRASYTFVDYNGVESKANTGIDGFQFSLNGGIGMEYKFIPSLGIYLEPNVVYFFNSDVPASIRTDQPAQVKAEIGFRFHINGK